jgi:protein-S-isoprenylcysteine O-methyltransferase Ste14
MSRATQWHTGREIDPRRALPAYSGAGGTWLFHRQVLREEDYLRRHYGHAYVDYCNRVRRYL